MVQSRSLVTNKIGYLLYSELRTDNPQHISHLEDEVRSCDKTHTGSDDTGHTDPVISSDIEASERDTRKVRLGDCNLPVDHPGVHLLPVLKMHRHLLAERDPEGIHILLRGDDQKLVTLLKDGVRSRQRHHSVTKDSGDHYRIAKILCGVLDCHSEDRGILDLAVHTPCHILIIILIVKDFLLLIEINFEYRLEEHHQSDHKQDSQRVGHSVGGSQPGGRRCDVRRQIVLRAH